MNFEVSVRVEFLFNSSFLKVVFFVISLNSLILLIMAISFDNSSMYLLLDASYDLDFIVAIFHPNFSILMHYPHA